MDESLLHKLSHLDLHKLSLSYNSLLQNFQGGRRGSKELNPREKYKITKFYPLSSAQSFLAGPWSSIYSLRENSPEDEHVAEIWDSTAQILRQFGGKLRHFFGRWIPDFCYKFVTRLLSTWPSRILSWHVEFSRSWIQIWALFLGFELISFNYC